MVKACRRGADLFSVRRRNRRNYLPCLLACACAAALTAPAASAKQNAATSWAQPQIKQVVAAGLMARSVASFHANDPLTQAELNELLVALPSDLVADPNTTEDPTTTDPTSTDPTSTVPTTTVPTTTVPTTTDPTTTDPTTTDPTHDPTLTVPTTTTPTTTGPTTTTPSGAPPGSPQPGAQVTLAAFDTALVNQLGLTGAATRFLDAARLVGLTPPKRFGSETVARLLGLRTNHPAVQDSLELLPGDRITRAEAAYSVAQVLSLRGEEAQWVDDVSYELTLPTLTSWQKRVLNYAIGFVGYPYIWGGSSPGKQVVFGRKVPGGFDCSGFVWRVYKLRHYLGGGRLSGTIRGRTTFTMSVEVPASKRIAIDALQPGDVIFFGAAGPRSKAWQINHTAIYLGDNWFVQSSGNGVDVVPLEGWYQKRFAWARRPLAEAGLTNVYSVQPS